MFGRWLMLVHVAAEMLFHGRLKTIGSLAGIIFSIVLAGQNLGALVGVTYQAGLFPEKASPDLWVLPHGTTLLGEGNALPQLIGMRLQAVPGIRSVEPVILGASEIKIPDGRRESVTVVGIERGAENLGPWNTVSGDGGNLLMPGGVIVEDTFRERTGATNLGSVREIGGREVRVVGTTWGMISWFPQFAWADHSLAREILDIPEGHTSFFVIRLEKWAEPSAVKQWAGELVPESEVLLQEEYLARLSHYVTVDAGAGAILVTSAAIGIFVGFVIVSLMMYNSVSDSLREFGAMKAIGASNGDLATIVMVQALMLGSFGSLIGGALLAWFPALMRSPNVIILIDLPMIAGLSIMMIVICVLASLISVGRLRAIEPGMIFR